MISRVVLSTLIGISAAVPSQLSASSADDDAPGPSRPHTRDYDSIKRDDLTNKSMQELVRIHHNSSADAERLRLKMADLQRRLVDAEVLAQETLQTLQRKRGEIVDKFLAKDAKLEIKDHSELGAIVKYYVTETDDIRNPLKGFIEALAKGANIDLLALTTQQDKDMKKLKESLQITPDKIRSSEHFFFMINIPRSLEDEQLGLLIHHLLKNDRDYKGIPKLNRRNSPQTSGSSVSNWFSWPF